jgi:hypothetical protein
MVFIFALVSIGWIVGLWSRRRSYASGGALNQFVELTPIKPNAAALRTVVNFNALAFGHQETGFWADGAFHRVPLCKVEP